MSTLTSLVKSGKRKIIKTRIGYTTATETASDLPDMAVAQQPTRPQEDTPVASNMTTLGLPDRGVSQDPMRPQDDKLSSRNMTVLGRPDREVSQDPMRPI